MATKRKKKSKPTAIVRPPVPAWLQDALAGRYPIVRVS